MMMVRLAMFEPSTFPTDSPPSPDMDDRMDTDSSGREVVMDSRINPAAISESPSTLDITKV